MLWTITQTISIGEIIEGFVLQQKVKNITPNQEVMR